MTTYKFTINKSEKYIYNTNPELIQNVNLANSPTTSDRLWRKPALELYEVLPIDVKVSKHVFGLVGSRTTENYAT